MPRIVRAALFSIRDLVLSAGPFILIALALLIGAYYVLKPAPPKRVVLATGPERSAFDEFGKRYAAELKRYGIEVVLKRTSGSGENRRALRDPKQDVDLGFLRGGVRSAESAEEEEPKDEEIDLVSLGTLFYEPVWIFYREKAARRLPGKALTAIAQMKGWRVNSGAKGAAVRGLFRRIIEANGLKLADLKESRHEDTQSVIELLGGDIDAIAMVAAPESQFVQMLLLTPGIRAFEFPQADAYARQFPFLSSVELPRGVVNIGKNVPARDMTLVASTVSMVARDDTHPAILQLFAQAAKKIHGGGGWVAKQGQFPVAQSAEFPLAAEAERLYRNGPPLLQRYLPFWLANLIDRMWVALFSIVAILIPLSRVVPPLYVLRIRSRLFRYYRRLRAIEEAAAERSEPVEELIRQLDSMDEAAKRIVVPVSYTDELYALRSYIDLVRARLRPAAAAPENA